MKNKIQELTDKIYDEGITKANVQATNIVANAEEQAAEIIEFAHKEEISILEQAKVKADEYQEIANAEIKLASRQSINNVKQQITNMIIAAQVEEPIKGAFKNGEFLKSIIQTLVTNWNPQKPEEVSLNVLLPQREKSEMMEFFKTKAFGELNQGIELQFDEKIANGFKIGPKDGSYIISFTDKDFEEYFKGYLKDKTKELLFSSKRADGSETNSKKSTVKESV